MGCLKSAKAAYYRGKDLRPATRIVVKNVRKSLVRILDINDLRTHDCHVDQVRFQEPCESVSIPAVNSNTHAHILDNT